MKWSTPAAARLLAAWMSFAVGVSAGHAQSADSQPTSAAAPPPDPDVIKLYMMDGSIIAGKLNTKDVEVQTKYGVLHVPVAEIKSFTPGLDSHPELEKTIDGLVAKLGGDDFQQRESAERELLRMGPPVKGPLQSHANDPDPERRRRVQAILEEFNAAAEDSDDPAPDTKSVLTHEDQMETNNFTLAGHIAAETFAVQSNYGPLTVKLSDIKRAARDVAVTPEEVKNVTVTAQNLVNKDFLATGLRVTRGDQVIIKAEGTIGMSPWGQQAQSTPDGAENYGWYAQGTIPNGSLVMKIGNGDVAKAGSKITLTADHSGELKFAFAMAGEYGNMRFPGQYKVKVRVIHKQ